MVSGLGHNTEAHRIRETQQEKNKGEVLRKARMCVTKQIFHARVHGPSQSFGVSKNPWETQRKNRIELLRNKKSLLNNNKGRGISYIWGVVLGAGSQTVLGNSISVNGG